MIYPKFKYALVRVPVFQPFVRTVSCCVLFCRSIFSHANAVMKPHIIHRKSDIYATEAVSTHCITSYEFRWLLWWWRCIRHNDVDPMSNHMYDNSTAQARSEYPSPGMQAFDGHLSRPPTPQNVARHRIALNTGFTALALCKHGWKFSAPLSRFLYLFSQCFRANRVALARRTLWRLGTYTIGSSNGNRNRQVVSNVESPLNRRDRHNPNFQFCGSRVRTHRLEEKEQDCTCVVLFPVQRRLDRCLVSPPRGQQLQIDRIWESWWLPH